MKASRQSVARLLRWSLLAGAAQQRMEGRHHVQIEIVCQVLRVLPCGLEVLPCSINSTPNARMAAFFSTPLPCGTTMRAVAWAASPRRRSARQLRWRRGWGSWPG